jgi:hypothetical protein
MPGSFYVSKIWFAREAMPPLQRLTLGKLLRQFFPVTSGRGGFLMQSRKALSRFSPFCFAPLREKYLPLARSSIVT